MNQDKYFQVLKIHTHIQTIFGTQPQMSYFPTPNIAAAAVVTIMSKGKK